MNYNINIKEIILKEPGGRSGTETFVYEPSTIDEEPRGTLYIIGWLENRKTRFEFLPNLIASLIRREFYKLSDGSIGEHFEAALKKANAALDDIGKTNKNISSDINFCVVNIAEDAVRFAKIGNMVTWLWRGGRIMDMSAKQKQTNKKDLFAAVISGAVEPKDRFIFATGQVMDLFSETGVKKLFALPLAEQADIITRIYEKNSARTSLSDQAAVLLDVKDSRVTSRWLPFQRKSDTTESRKEKVISTAPGRSVIQTLNQGAEFLQINFARHKNILKWLACKENIPLAAAILGLVLVSAGTISVERNITAVHQLTQKIVQADALAQSDVQTAETMLKNIQQNALHMASVWYLAPLVKNVVENANISIARLHGIYMDPLSLIAAIPTRAVAFAPTFIHNDSVFLYVFGKSPDTYFAVDKSSGVGFFIFLPQLPESFETERVFAQSGDFYFINDTKKSAYVLFAGTHELTKVVKSLATVLQSASAVNARERNGLTYALAHNNQIIKTDAAGKTETMLLQNIPPPQDFELSDDGKEIYVLVQNAVLVFPHQ